MSILRFVALIGHIPNIDTQLNWDQLFLTSLHQKTYFNGDVYYKIQHNGDAFGS